MQKAILITILALSIVTTIMVSVSTISYIPWENQDSNAFAFEATVG